MELKNILSKLSSSRKEKEKIFLAIEISNETVKTACWTVKDGATKILKVGSIEEWEDKTELLTSAIDSSVTITLEGVKSEPVGVIFGLPESWIEKDQITTQKKKILKKICEEFEFKPLGFVATIEALIDYLKTIEGTPVSAVFVDLQETQITTTLVNLGKIIGSEMVGKSEDLAADIREGLARFENIENYPSRIILFDGVVDFEEAKQQIISFDWLKDLPFLHFPKVESLDTNIAVKAVAISGGREVAKSLGFEIVEVEEGQTGDEGEPDEKKATLRTQKDTKITEDTKKSQSVQEDSDGSVLQEFGFVEDEDIVEVEKKEGVKKQKSGEESDRKAATLRTQKETESTETEETREEKPAIKVKEGEKETEIVEKQKTEEKEKKKKVIFGKISKVFAAPLSLASKIKKLPLRLLSIPFAGKAPFMLGVAAFLLIGLFIGGFLAYWNLLKAKVTIFVSPKTLEETLTFTISSSAVSVDEEKGIIPGEEKKIEVEGKKTAQTTGKVLIGEKAKGEVVVFNKTDVGKTFSTGTVLVGPDNKKFSLDEEVKIASKSSQTTEEGEQITYGKTTVGITATSIGTEFNLAGGTSFKLKEYSESLFSAKTNDGLSGGTSREVKAVSEEDQDNLLSSLINELKFKAREKLETELEAKKRVLEKGMKEEIISQQFNKKADEETDNLSLELKLKLTTLTFSEDDLDVLSMNSIRDVIPPDFTLKESLKTEIGTGEVEKGEGKIEMIIIASLVPKLDSAEIKKNLVGRYPAVVEEYLGSLPNFLRAEIKIFPKLPAKLRTLPRKESNIQLEIEVEE